MGNPEIGSQALVGIGWAVNPEQPGTQRFCAIDIPHTCILTVECEYDRRGAQPDTLET